jgi:sugar lactone lactonase YvrE
MTGIKHVSIQLLLLGIVCIESCKKNPDTTTPPVVPEQKNPHIDSFNPGAAAKDSVVVISGSNFSTVAIENTVTINEVPAEVIVAANNRLEVKVPLAPGSGKIVVKVNGHTAGSASDFIYIPTVSTLAGGTHGYLNGPGNIAQFASAFGVAADAAGNIIVADGGNNRIRRIAPDGTVSTVAGDGTAGILNGPAATARFSYPRGVAVDATGNIYVADADNNLIRKITPQGIVSTVAGDSTRGFRDGPAAQAKFDFPFELVVDPSGNIYVTDGGNHRVRKITTAGEVITVGEPTLGVPEGIAMDASLNLYIADAASHKIFKMTPAGVRIVLAGTGEAGFTNGSGTIARFFNPEGIAVDKDGNVYVGDLSNNVIRKITPAGIVSTFAGGTRGFKDGPATESQFFEVSGVAVDASGNIIVADVLNSRIRKIK